MAVTSLAIAIHLGAKPTPEGHYTMGSIESVGIPFMGGCVNCEASIACYNAYPSKCGYLMCKDCIGDTNGFDTVEEAVKVIFAEEEA